MAVAGPGCYGEVAEGPPYEAQVLDLDEIDPDTREPAFSLATRTFTYLEDLDSLFAPELTLSRGGAIEARELAGSLVSDGRIAGADAPGLRYRVDGGRAVARDYPTLIMLTAYYHYEQLLADLERVAGFSSAEFVDDFGPLDIYFEPSIRITTEDSVETQTPKFNAFYVIDAGQFGLAQRSEFEAVPLSANPLVIAHEFGHALFEHTFDEGAPVLCTPGGDNSEDPLFPGRLRSEYGIAGLDEGFADFVSFAYTGGANPIAGFPIASADARDFAEPNFTLEDLVVQDGQQTADPPCEGQFYCIGTLFAGALYETMIDLGYDPQNAADRGSFSRTVISAMTGMREAIRTQSADLLPEPGHGVRNCVRHEGAPRVYDAEVVAAFLSAFVPRMPEEAREPLCDQLAARFGELGFPDQARGACGEAS